MVLAFGTSETCNIRDDLAAARKWHQPHCDCPAVSQSWFDRFDADTCGEEVPAQDLLRLMLSTPTPYRPIADPSSVCSIASYPLLQIRLLSLSFFMLWSSNLVFRHNAIKALLPCNFGPQVLESKRTPALHPFVPVLGSDSFMPSWRVRVLNAGPVTCPTQCPASTDAGLERTTKRIMEVLYFNKIILLSLECHP